MHHEESTREDMKLINSRVVGQNLALPSFEEFHGNDVSWNLISDNIFATILEKCHPKEYETFEIPEQTIIIKGNFSHLKTNEPKSSSYHFCWLSYYGKC